MIGHSICQFCSGLCSKIRPVRSDAASYQSKSASVPARTLGRGIISVKVRIGPLRTPRFVRSNAESYQSSPNRSESCTTLRTLGSGTVSVISRIGPRRTELFVRSNTASYQSIPHRFLSYTTSGTLVLGIESVKSASVPVSHNGSYAPT